MPTFKSSPDYRPAKGRRLRAAALGVALAVALCGGVATLFAQASQAPWLPDTPQAVAVARGCAQQPTRDGRDVCMAQAARRWQAADRAGLRLAGAGH
jgi:hypothetical protein